MPYRINLTEMIGNLILGKVLYGRTPKVGEFIMEGRALVTEVRPGEVDEVEAQER
jgi:hypothetical protein